MSVFIGPVQCPLEVFGLVNLFFEQDEFDAVDAVEATRNDSNFLVAEFAIEGAGWSVADVGVHAQSLAAAVFGVAFVKVNEGTAVAVAFHGWIDDQGMHDHDGGVGCIDGPWRTGVFVALQVIDNGCTNDAPVGFF